MSNRLLSQMAIATLMLAGGGLASEVAKVAEADAEDRRYDRDQGKRKAADMAPARTKPSGSKPVAGGGARERARRLARMNVLQTETE